MVTHTDDLYVAIDLGSATLRGMVGYKTNGKVFPIAIAEVPSGNAIRKGSVCNLEDLHYKLESLINELTNQLPNDQMQIRRVYIGFGGQSLMSRTFSIRHRMENPDGEMISQNHIDMIYDRIKECHYNAQEVLDISRPYYIVDGRVEKVVKGMLCHEFSVHFNIITTRSSNVSFIRLVIEERLGLELVGILPAPCCEADVLLFPDARNLGVALVNFGAGTTSVAIYKGDILKTLRVIPFGSKNINNDLMTLSLTYPDAEKIKLETAQPFTDAYDDQELLLPSADGLSERSFKLRDINSLATGRLIEITANVIRVIQDFETTGNRLGAGVILTGQGALMRNYLQYFQRERQFVTLARELNSEKVCKDETSMASDIDYAGCMGLIYNAQTNCVESTPYATSTPRTEPVAETKTTTNVAPDPVETTSVQIEHDEEETVDPKPQQASLFDETPTATPRREKETKTSYTADPSPRTKPKRTKGNKTPWWKKLEGWLNSDEDDEN